MRKCLFVAVSRAAMGFCQLFRTPVSDGASERASTSSNAREYVVRVTNVRLSVSDLA